MFPACAGMNRRLTPPALLPVDVPRMRGDEPFIGDDGTEHVLMFPACAGMNRLM